MTSVRTPERSDAIRFVSFPTPALMSTFQGRRWCDILHEIEYGEDTMRRAGEREKKGVAI